MKWILDQLGRLPENYVEDLSLDLTDMLYEIHVGRSLSKLRVAVGRLCSVVGRSWVPRMLHGKRRGQLTAIGQLAKCFIF